MHNITRGAAHRSVVAVGIASVLAAAAVDQVAKGLILHVVMQPPQVIGITPFLNLTLSFNPGISFGFLPASGSLAVAALIAFQIASTLLLLWLMQRSDTRVLACAFGLIAGGAVGNIIDRMRQGAVTDFIDVHASGWHFPTFNTADIAISAGVALLIANEFGWVKRLAVQRSA